MKRARFVEDAKQAPQRYYRTPFDVIRDRRLTNGDRLEVLNSGEKELSGSSDDQVAEKLDQLRRAREEIERSNDTQQPPERGLEAIKPQR